MIGLSLLQRTMNTISPWSRHWLQSQGRKSVFSDNQSGLAPTTINLQPVNANKQFLERSLHIDQFTNSIVQRQMPKIIVNVAHAQRKKDNSIADSNLLPLITQTAGALEADSTEMSESIQPAQNIVSASPILDSWLMRDTLQETGSNRYLETSTVGNEEPTGQTDDYAIVTRLGLSSIAEEIEQRIQRSLAIRRGEIAHQPTSPQPTKEAVQTQQPFSAAAEIQRRIDRATASSTHPNTNSAATVETNSMPLPTEQMAVDEQASEQATNAGRTDTISSGRQANVNATEEIERRIAQAAQDRLEKSDAIQRNSQVRDQASMTPQKQSVREMSSAQLPPQIRRMRAMSQVEEIGSRQEKVDSTLPLAMPATELDFVAEHSTKTEHPVEQDSVIEERHDSDHLPLTSLHTNALTSSYSINDSVVDDTPGQISEPPRPDSVVQRQAADSKGVDKVSREKPNANPQDVGEVTTLLTQDFGDVIPTKEQGSSIPDFSSNAENNLQRAVAPIASDEVEISNHDDNLDTESSNQSMQALKNSVVENEPTHQSVETMSLPEKTVVQREANAQEQLDRPTNKQDSEPTEHDTTSQIEAIQRNSTNDKADLANRSATSRNEETKYPEKYQMSQQISNEFGERSETFDSPSLTEQKTARMPSNDSAVEFPSQPKFAQRSIQANNTKSSGTQTHINESIMSALDMPLAKPAIQRQTRITSPAPKASAAINREQRSANVPFHANSGNYSEVMKPSAERPAFFEKLAANAPSIERRVDIATLQRSSLSVSKSPVASNSIVQHQQVDENQPLPTMIGMSSTQSENLQSPAVDLDALAQEILPIVKRILSVEREREPLIH